MKLFVLTALIQETRNVPPDTRTGQHAFNVLADLCPEVASQIRGTTADPFYTDANLPAFWDAVTFLLK